MYLAVTEMPESYVQSFHCGHLRVVDLVVNVVVVVWVLKLIERVHRVSFVVEPHKTIISDGVHFLFVPLVGIHLWV